MESTEKSDALKLAEADLLRFEKEWQNFSPKSTMEAFHFDLMHLAKVKTYFEAKDGSPSLSYHKYLYGKK